MIDEAVLERTLHTALRDGGDFAEVFAEDRRVATARLDDAKIEELVTGRERGAGIRVVRGDTTGYAHTADLSEHGLNEAAASAAAAAAAHPARRMSSRSNGGTSNAHTKSESFRRRSRRRGRRKCSSAPTKLRAPRTTQSAR